MFLDYIEYLNSYILLIILIIIIYLIKNNRVIQLNQIGGEGIGSKLTNIFSNTYDLGVKQLSNSINTIDNIVTNISCNNKNKEQCSNDDKNCIWVEDNGCIGKLKKIN